MELKDIIGLRNFDAVDFSNESVKTWGDSFEDCQVCRFRLDGIVYVATEDPNDGYRSSMRDIFVDEKAEMKNIFTGIQVLCTYHGDCQDILQVIDVKTGRVVLVVGTDNTDDYYPYFVARFSPENMCLNMK